MADLSTYLVLGTVLLPPLVRQAQRLASKLRSSHKTSSAQPHSPKFFSRARLTPFASSFSTTVTIAASLFILISFRNLIPTRYGIDFFIPASVIDRLREYVYAVFTASRTPLHPYGAPLHFDFLRGGYKPDLFLAYKAPITVPTTTLRNLINDTPSLLPIGPLTDSKRAELQALVARLSSFEGRRIYLLLGSRPLLDCTFCNTTNDYFAYAVPLLLATYAWRIVALGLLTTHPDDSVAVAIRQAASLLNLFSRSSPQTSGSNGSGNDREFEADRSGWRISSLVILVSLLVVELLIMFEFGQVSAELSRLNHWHSNLHILRQLVFAALLLAIYLFPAPRITDNFQQSMLHLDSTHQSLQSLMHVSQLVDVTRTVVFEDTHMSSSDIGPDMAERIIQAATSHGGQAATDAIAQAQAGVQRVTRFWWRNAELVNRRLDQQEATSATTSSDPLRTS